MGATTGAVMDERKESNSSSTFAAAAAVACAGASDEGGLRSADLKSAFDLPLTGPEDEKDALLPADFDNEAAGGGGGGAAPFVFFATGVCLSSSSFSSSSAVSFPSASRAFDGSAKKSAGSVDDDWEVLHFFEPLAEDSGAADRLLDDEEEAAGRGAEEVEAEGRAAGLEEVDAVRPDAALRARRRERASDMS